MDLNTINSHFSDFTVADPVGGPGPPGPQSWGPRLYAEAQITPFDT